MRIVILTSSQCGFASYCLPLLAQEPNIEIAMIVYNEGQSFNPWKVRKRKLKKIQKIGLLGAINGVRIRPWFSTDVSSYLRNVNLDIAAHELNIRLETTPTINCQRTIDLFGEADAELGLSLGNGYIGPRVFSALKYGMINVHHEVLPQFRGAQSIIWQIYEGSVETGYTIHQLDEHIDTGNILYQEKLPIELRPTLRETVSLNYARLYEFSAKGLSRVVSDYTEYPTNAKPQIGGQSFTTPSLWQYLRIVRQHKRLYRKYINDSYDR